MGATGLCSEGKERTTFGTGSQFTCLDSDLGCKKGQLEVLWYSILPLPWTQTHCHPDSSTAMASDSNKNKGISANMASTTEGRMSQTAPTNDDHTRRPRWSDGEDKMLCDILKTQ
jgi:hypothetical protein